MCSPVNYLFGFAGDSPHCALEYPSCLRSQYASTLVLSTLMQCACMCPEYASTLVLSTLMQCACLCPEYASTLILVLSTAANAVCLFVPLVHKYASTQYGRLCSVPVVCALNTLVRQYLVRPRMQCACLCSQYLSTLVLSTDGYAVCLFDHLGMKIRANSKHMKVRNVLV